MPFEKKKRYKTPKDYKQKNLYLNESDPYQYECIKVLELCGHKQAKFLGLLVHDYIQKSGVNVNCIDNKGFTKLIGLLEEQVKGGISVSMHQMGMVMQPVMMQQSPYMPMESTVSTVLDSDVKDDKRNPQDDEPFEAEDLGEMADALKAFGSF